MEENELTDKIQKVDETGKQGRKQEGKGTEKSASPVSERYMTLTAERLQHYVILSERYIGVFPTALLHVGADML